MMKKRVTGLGGVFFKAHDPEDTDYYHPSKKDFMFNYRIENLEELLHMLREEGVEIVGEIEKYPYGKFGWIMDPEGNRVELWESLDEGKL